MPSVERLYPLNGYPTRLPRFPVLQPSVDLFFVNVALNRAFSIPTPVLFHKEACMLSSFLLAIIPRQVAD